jgi:hypothetical protein
MHARPAGWARYQEMRKLDTSYYLAQWLMRGFDAPPPNVLWMLLQASWEADHFDSLGYEHPTKFIPLQSVMIRTGDVRTATVGYSSCSDDLRRMCGNPDRAEKAKYKFGVERVLFYHLPACRLVASFDDRTCGPIHLEMNPPSVATDASQARAESSGTPATTREKISNVSNGRAEGIVRR